MMFMNEYEIDRAYARYLNHPVLGPATRTLAALRDAANANSDGWCYWPKPSRAARKLQELISGDPQSRDYERLDATPEKLRAAYSPIKAFRTRSGLQFEITEELPAPAAEEVSNGTFTVTIPRTYRAGWGVAFIPVWDDDKRVSDVVSDVVQITADRVRLIGGVPCVPLSDDGAYCPVENFLDDLVELTGDDTHDLRDRWFATEELAREHERYTMDRYRNPQIWESFVEL